MLPRRPSPATALALVALFVALGGTSFAVVQLRANSVRSQHIKNGQVKRADIRRNAVNSAKVANRSLRLVDFGRGQIPAGPAGPSGPAGSSGPAGPPGETGAAGARGPSDVRVARQPAEDIAIATCDPAPASVAACPDLLSRTLGAGNWLIQAKLTVDNDAGGDTVTNRCGLLVGGAQVDEAAYALDANMTNGQREALALTAVVTGVSDGTLATLRCTEGATENQNVEDVVVTALQVENVTGP